MGMKVGFESGGGNVVESGSCNGVESGGCDGVESGVREWGSS